MMLEAGSSGCIPQQIYPSPNSPHHIPPSPYSSWGRTKSTIFKVPVRYPHQQSPGSAVCYIYRNMNTRSCCPVSTHESSDVRQLSPATTKKAAQHKKLELLNRIERNAHDYIPTPTATPARTCPCRTSASPCEPCGTCRAWRFWPRSTSTPPPSSP